jgi:hypothetical protein
VKAGIPGSCHWALADSVGYGNFVAIGEKRSEACFSDQETVAESRRACRLCRMHEKARAAPIFGYSPAKTFSKNSVDRR